jgi:hypothetical protein
MAGVSTTQTRLMDCYRPASTDIQRIIVSGVQGTRLQQSHCCAVLCRDCVAGPLRSDLHFPCSKTLHGEPTHVAATPVRVCRRTTQVRRDKGWNQPHTGVRSEITCCFLRMSYRVRLHDHRSSPTFP